MKKPEKITPVMEFVFQTIKLDQVADLIPTAYRSRYEAIRIQVIEKVKSMPGDETFMFQPLDKKAKLDENLIARICSGINVGLVRESLNWKISYSDKASAFVVAPYKRNKRPGRRGEFKINQSGSAVSNAPGTNGSISDDEGARIKKLLELTHKHLGATLHDLQEKHSGDEMLDIRRAFFYVGRNTMGIKLSHLGKLLGITSGTSSVQCGNALEILGSKEHVKTLTAAITTNGGGHKA